MTFRSAIRNAGFTPHSNLFRDMIWIDTFLKLALQYKHYCKHQNIHIMIFTNIDTSDILDIYYNNNTCTHARQESRMKTNNWKLTFRIRILLVIHHILSQNTRIWQHILRNACTNTNMRHFCNILEHFIDIWCTIWM